MALGIPPAQDRPTAQVERWQRNGPNGRTPEVRWLCTRCRQVVDRHDRYCRGCGARFERVAP